MQRVMSQIGAALPLAVGLICAFLSWGTDRSLSLPGTTVALKHPLNFEYLNSQCIQTSDSISWKQIFWFTLPASNVHPRVAACHALLTKAISEEPTYDVLWHNRAWCDRLHGDTEASLSDLSTALTLSPNDALYLSSQVLFALADRNEAAGVRPLSLAIAASPRILGSSFIQDLRLGHPALLSAALDRAKVALSATPNDPIVQAKLGRIAVFQGDLANAGRLLRSSLQTLPNLGGAWRTLAYIEASEGFTREAQADALKASFLLGRPIEVSDLISASASLSTASSSPHSDRFRVRYHRALPLHNDLLPRDLPAYVSSDF